MARDEFVYEHFAGIGRTSVKETSVCIVDDMGRMVREVKVASEPEVLLPVLTNPLWLLQAEGLEAGPRCRSGFLARLPRQACR